MDESGIQFTSEESSYTRPAARVTSGPTRWLIAWGIAKDTRGANAILIGVAVLAFAVAGYLLLGGGSTNAHKIPPGATLVSEPGVPPHLLAPVAP